MVNMAILWPISSHLIATSFSIGETVGLLSNNNRTPYLLHRQKSYHIERNLGYQLF